MSEGIGFLHGMSMIGVGLMLFLLPVATISVFADGSPVGVGFVALVVFYFWLR